LTAAAITVTVTGSGYVTISTGGCQWTGTGACPYSWGNCQCGQGIYETRSNPRPNVEIISRYAPLDRLVRLVRLSREFTEEASKKKTHHDHLIQRHIRSRRPDRATRFKSKAHVWSTPAGAPQKYL